MRLINYGPGEIVDRLTILELKILHGRASKKAIDHFEKERAALLTQLRSRVDGGMNWFEHTLELAVVNGQIWNGEELLRTYRGKLLPADVEVAIAIAFSLQEWNDRRHELIRRINVGAGEHQGAEKV
jgi:hypothetical protein